MPTHKSQPYIPTTASLVKTADQLEQQVQESQTQAEQFLQAVLKETFNDNAKNYKENELLTMDPEV